MQKKYLILFTLLITGLGTWFFLRPSQSGTLDKGKTDFAVENTNEISKIFISNRLNGHVLLEKKKGEWYVNGKYKASKPQMDFLLNETLKKIRVLGAVPKPARENIIATMATMATKVEIYEGNKLMKVYYVGQPTNDMSGTYMYLEGSNDPYITHIPGFNGFLTVRYPVTETDWVSKVVFDFKPEEIKSVEVSHTEKPNESFTITRKDNSNDFDITASVGAKSGTPNYGAVKSYFSLFANKTCEGYISLSQIKRDSIKKTAPYCTLTLIDKNSNIHKLNVYKRISEDHNHSLFDKKGNRLTYDPSRYNAFLNNDTRMMVIQDIVFDPILISYSDFFLKQTVD